MLQDASLRNIGYNGGFRSRIRKISLFRSEVEFFLNIINCKSNARGLTTQFNFSKFEIQREKTLLFYHEETWEAEEKFRLRYCLRFLIAFKQQSGNTSLSSHYNSIMNLGAVFRRFKILLTYLRNSLVSDVDRTNSRFLLFLYFLTQSRDLLVSKNDNMSKKKRILRNLFFIFIFAQERLVYFFGLTHDNPILSRRSIKLNKDPKFSASIFPKGLFLLLYSPYKVMYQFGSSKMALTKYKTFLQRLEYSAALSRVFLPEVLVHSVKNNTTSVTNESRYNFLTFSKTKRRDSIYSKIQQYLVKVRSLVLPVRNCKSLLE